nr:MAG TPA: hypothetical protein [Caudoviricetes sp.]
MACSDFIRIGHAHIRSNHQLIADIPKPLFSCGKYRIQVEALNLNSYVLNNSLRQCVVLVYNLYNFFLPCYAPLMSDDMTDA